MANLTTNIPSSSLGRANVAQQQPDIHTVYIPAQANGVTRGNYLPTLKRKGYVVSMRYMPNTAATATSTLQAAKLNADDGTAGGIVPASANVKMAAAANNINTTAAQNIVELSLYAPGTSGQTDYQDDEGNWVNSNLWFDENDRIGAESVTSGGAGTFVFGTLEITVKYKDGYVASRATA